MGNRVPADMIGDFLKQPVALRDLTPEHGEGAVTVNAVKMDADHGLWVAPDVAVQFEPDGSDSEETHFVFVTRLENGGYKADLSMLRATYDQKFLPTKQPIKKDWIQFEEIV